MSDEADVALAQDFTSARSSPAGSSRSSRASASPTSCASPRAARRASPSPPLAQPRLAFEPRHSIADVSHPARSHLFNPRFPDNFVYLIQDIRDADDQNLIRIFPQSVLLSLSLSLLSSVRLELMLASLQSTSVHRLGTVGRRARLRPLRRRHQSLARHRVRLLPLALLPAASPSADSLPAQHRLRHDQDRAQPRGRVRLCPSEAVLRRAAHRVRPPARGASSSLLLVSRGSASIGLMQVDPYRRTGP